MFTLIVPDMKTNCRERFDFMKFRAVVLIFMASALTACASASASAGSSSVEVIHPWVRTVGGMEGMGGSTTALFMTLQNNADTPDRLLKVESIVIPARETVKLKSGSYHIMLMGLKQEMREGDTLIFTLTFEKAGKITVEAPVKNP